MCLQAGIPGCKTNHSLRAACATQLYEAGTPENLIQDRTGHRSLSSLRKYERPSEMQLQACGDVLDSTRPIKFQSSEGHYINKENTDPASTVPPIGSRSNIYASRMPVSTPQSADQCTLSPSDQLSDSNKFGPKKREE